MENSLATQKAKNENQQSSIFSWFFDTNNS